MKWRPASSRVPQYDAKKSENGRLVRPTLSEQQAAAIEAARSRRIVSAPVPAVSHTLWLALPDSDEFMVCCILFYNALMLFPYV